MSVDTNPPARLPHHDALLACATALLPQLHPAAVLAERSAAYLWGVDAFPRAGSMAGQVQHVCLPPQARGRAQSSVRVHRARLVPQERAETEGIPLTAPMRTAVDCAVNVRSLYLATGLVDRFLAAGLVSADERRARWNDHGRGRHRRGWSVCWRWHHRRASHSRRAGLACCSVRQGCLRPCRNAGCAHSWGCCTPTWGGRDRPQRWSSTACATTAHSCSAVGTRCDGGR